jgi:hypothetical protein
VKQSETVGDGGDVQPEQAEPVSERKTKARVVKVKEEFADFDIEGDEGGEGAAGGGSAGAGKKRALTQQKLPMSKKALPRVEP